MLTTNESSLEMWCPLMEIANPHDESDHHCATEICMMWRWYDSVDYEGERRGYCGLAGKVEVS